MKKVLILLLAMAMALTVGLLASCDLLGGGTTPPEPNEHVHEFGDWDTLVKATCTKRGTRERYCEPSTLSSESFVVRSVGRCVYH